MKLDVYGRFFAEVVRDADRWSVYRIDQGRRMKMGDLSIPDSLPPEEVARFLEDLWHEYALPGRRIRLLDERRLD
jgi:hypothetical protein